MMKRPIPGMRKRSESRPTTQAVHDKRVLQANRNAETIRRAENSKKIAQNGDAYKLEGLDRVVSILDLLGSGNDSLSLAEICQRMELRKSTAHRALMALERTGLIERAAGNRYRLGLKLYDMGSRAVEQIDLRSRLHPYLRKLALRVGETVHLGVLHKTRVVYIDKIEPINRRVCISSRTGTSNPVYSTSMGKAILAFLPAAEMAEIVSQIEFKSFTSKTLNNTRELMEAVDRVRRRGYAIDDEEMEIGTRCVGAPILDANQRAIAALSVSGSAVRLAAHCVPGIAEHVVRCGQEISAALCAQGIKDTRHHRAAAFAPGEME